MQKLMVWALSFAERVKSGTWTGKNLYWSLVIAVGIISGLCAVSIQKLAHFITGLIGANQTFDLNTILFSLTFLIISSWLTFRYFPSTSGSGIPGVKIALVVYHGKMSFLSAAMKWVTSILSLSSGMPLGREGPTVAVSSAVASSLGQWFGLEKRQIKSLVAMGAAGGIAAGFNTPMAAVVFALEEVVGNLNAKVLGSMIVSTVAASITAASFNGSHSIFTPVHYSFKFGLSSFLYLLIGISAALAGPLFVSLILKLRFFRKKYFSKLYFIPIILALMLVAVASHYSTDLLGSGHEFLNQLLQGKNVSKEHLIILLVIKSALIAFCYSTGISGGLFMPTLFVGGAVGALIGGLVPGMSGAGALVGMGAFFAAVIRAPFTSILMIFEMTQDYNIILPLMLANITAFTLSSKIRKQGLYESLSEQDGIFLPGNDDSELLESMIIEDAMIEDVIAFEANKVVEEIPPLIKNTQITGFPVLSQNKILGIISSDQINRSIATGKSHFTAGDICTKQLITVFPDQSLLFALDKIKKHRVSRLLVVSRINHRKLVGIITAEDIIQKFGHKIVETPESVN